MITLLVRRELILFIQILIMPISRGMIVLFALMKVLLPIWFTLILCI